MPAFIGVGPQPGLLCFPQVLQSGGHERLVRIGYGEQGGGRENLLAAFGNDNEVLKWLILSTLKRISGRVTCPVHDLPADECQLG